MSFSTLYYQPIKCPTYRLNKFSYTFKLNQRIKAAAVRKDSIFYPSKGGMRSEIVENIIMKEPVEPRENFVNTECSPPIPAIRKWKIWVKTPHRVYCIGKCFPCK